MSAMRETRWCSCNSILAFDDGLPQSTSLQTFQLCFLICKQRFIDWQLYELLVWIGLIWADTPVCTCLAQKVHVKQFNLCLAIVRVACGVSIRNHKRSTLLRTFVSSCFCVTTLSSGLFTLHTKTTELVLFTLKSLNKLFSLSLLTQDDHRWATNRSEPWHFWTLGHVCLLIQSIKSASPCLCLTCLSSLLMQSLLCLA